MGVLGGGTMKEAQEVTQQKETGGRRWTGEEQKRVHTGGKGPTSVGGQETGVGTSPNADSGAISRDPKKLQSLHSFLYFPRSGSLVGGPVGDPEEFVDGC